jgi:hypothetical protein
VARCAIVKQKPLPLPACQPLGVAPLPLQTLHAEMTSKTLSVRHELMAQQSFDVEEFRELFDCLRTCGLEEL